ncbi:ligase [Aureococcus anophagefferens]|uniref:Ligase n=1 Tax=Aureococcus anophagefferens TaxID=44056 RepID=A0ABR1G1V3_AURAN
MVKLLLSKGADIDLAVIDNGHLRNNSNADAYAIIEAVVDGGGYESFTRAHRHFLCRGVGEVWIRGPTLFSARATTRGDGRGHHGRGWFRTDDLVKVDGDGYLTVLDRATDMIVVCSENAYRVGSSARARRAPRVELATVYGMPDDAMGERVKAVVVKQDESSRRRRSGATPRQARGLQGAVVHRVHGPGRPAHDGLGQGRQGRAQEARREARRGAQGRAREPQAGGPAPVGHRDHASRA